MAWESVDLISWIYVPVCANNLFYWLNVVAGAETNWNFDSACVCSSAVLPICPRRVMRKYRERVRRLLALHGDGVVARASGNPSTASFLETKTQTERTLSSQLSQ